jgi:hypothetical protein
MNVSDIINYRLINQQIAKTSFSTPQEIVSWMVAMQAQEYAMSKWAIGLRLNNVTDADVEKAFNDGQILRTHVLRPTWHFATPEDIRWLLELTAPRIRKAMAYYERELELDSKLFNKCNDIIGKALTGGHHLTRLALSDLLQNNGIGLNGRQMGHVMMNAEMDCLVCSGRREGKQFTYALFDERASTAISIDKDEALLLLAEQYFASRGPATLKDFSVWSGLTITDAKKAGAMLDSKVFVKEVFDGNEYLLKRETLELALDASLAKKGQKSFLMPDYDEYGMGYIDRTAIFNPIKLTSEFRKKNPVFDRMVIVDGIIEGTWKRTIKGKSVVVETYLFRELNKAKSEAVKKSVDRFVKFTGSSE